jgi:hypothetical protein
LGEIGWGGNGGFHALNLAIQFGARRIVLVGYDCRIDLGINWHGGHQHGLPNKGIVSVIRWRQVLDAQAPSLKQLGVEVLNASAVSALTAYPKVEFAAAMQGKLDEPPPLASLMSANRTRTDGVITARRAS